MIAIIDYGCGNLFSLKSSLNFIGAECVITGDIKTIKSADRIILPGVGAFEDAMKKLNESGLVKTLKKECVLGDKPLLGICLGMQILFEKSFEYGEHKGLGIIKGDVVPFKPQKGYKIPHMGWNSLNFKNNNQNCKKLKMQAIENKDIEKLESFCCSNNANGESSNFCSPIFKYINNGDYVYFVHSYYATNCKDNIIATTNYPQDEVTVAVQKDNIFGLQFHPEKSGEVGLNILKAFLEI